MKISRRDFLKGSATTLFLAGFNLPALAVTSKKKNLVVIMLRGGMDGLCAVPIIGDKNFEKKRKNILIENTIKLNSDFALHPKLKGFNDCWNENTGTIVHATSIPYTQRSHFEGQNLMETGGRIPYKDKTGWVGRAMKLANLEGDVTAGTVDTNIIKSTDSSNIRIQEAVEISGAVVGGSTANFTGAVTSGGTLTGTSLTCGDAVLTEAELETIDTITAGTVAASKAVVVDASKDVTGFNDITATGTVTGKIGDFESIQSTDSTGVTINDNLVMNGSIIAEDSSAINIVDGLNVGGAISGDSIDVNEINSGDSTAIQVNDGINCSGTVSANELDTSRIFNTDSSAIKIDDALELAGELNHTGNVVHVTGVTQLSRETLSGDSAGTDAVSVATDVTFLDMSGGGQTLSIADGLDGQIKYIICNQVGTVAGGGNATPAILDNTNGNWTTAIRFDAVGESVTLIFDSQTGKWNIVGSQGVTIT